MGKFKSLKTKLIVITTTIVFITAALNLAVGIYASYKSITKNVESDLESIGETVEVAIDTSLNNIKLGVEVVAGSNTIGTESQADVVAMLNTQAKVQGYLSLSVADANGVLTSTDTALTGKSISDKDYFKKALSGETNITTTTYDSNNQLCVIAAAPVANNLGYKGVVMAELDPQVYSNIIKNITVGKTGNVFIIDKDGAIIANVRPELVENRTNMIEMAKTDNNYKTIGAVHANMVAGKSGVEVYAYETGDRICYYQTINNTGGWSYGAVAPIAEMTSTITYTIFGLGVSSILCIILGIILTVITSNSIARPISQVCGRLELLAKGDLNSDVVEVNSIDETGILASSLNQTVESVKGYISEITRILHEVAKGNLNVQVNGEFDGDFAPIKDSLTTITHSLNSILSEIDQASEQVLSSSEQVSNGAQLLAQGASEQASSVEELSATIMEISNHVKENAQDALKASTNVNQVASEIEISNNYMNEMVQSMSDIKHSSNEIGKIIKAIEDIAFQTNILALNAAVEAARAGSAGKGFAVVADEVRNLATKSAEAAMNTTNLIENSIKQVETGSNIANDTAESLVRVIESAKIVSEVVERISNASNQQADAIGQVTIGVDQISNIVQTNSATSEESAAASEELSGQASVMKQLVSRFKLKSDYDEY